MFFERTNLNTIAAAATQVINDLQQAGFILKYVNVGSVSDTYLTPITATKAVLEAGPNVDPLYATQPWRVMIDGTGSNMYFYYGTSTQLPDSGTPVSGYVTGIAFATAMGALPWTYKLAVTNRGFVVSTWGSAATMLAYINCCQRLVSSVDGSVLVTKHSPVFLIHVYGISGPTTSVSVIREDDITVPQALVSFAASSSRSLLAWNATNTQPPLVDSNGNYLIQNFKGLMTPRAIYMEEMDMIMMASSLGFVSDQDVTFNAYGQPRTYLSTLPLLTAARFFMLHKINGVNV